MTNTDIAQNIINKIGDIPIATWLLIRPCPCGKIHLILTNEKYDPIIQANLTINSALEYIDDVKKAILIMREFADSVDGGTTAGRAH